MLERVHPESAYLQHTSLVAQSSDSSQAVVHSVAQARAGINIFLCLSFPPTVHLKPHVFLPILIANATRRNDNVLLYAYLAMQRYHLHLATLTSLRADILLRPRLQSISRHDISGLVARCTRQRRSQLVENCELRAQLHCVDGYLVVALEEEKTGVAQAN